MTTLRAFVFLLPCLAACSSTAAGSADLPQLGAGSSVTIAAATPTWVVADETHVYFNDYGVRPNGSANIDTSMNLPQLGTVNVAPASGGAVTVIASQQPNLSGLAVQAGVAYWGTIAAAPDDGTGALAMLTGHIHMAPITGGDTIIANGVAPMTIVTDATNVYWIDLGGPGDFSSPIPVVGSIHAMPLGGGPDTVLLAAGAVRLLNAGLAVDAQFLYFSADGNLQKVPLAGGAPQVVAPGGADHLVLSGSNLLFTDPTAHTVRSVPVTGGTSTVTVTVPGNGSPIVPIVFVADATNAYLVQSLAFGGDSGATLYEGPIGGAAKALDEGVAGAQETVLFAQGQNDGTAYSSIAANSTAVFVAGNGGITIVPK